MTVYVFGNPEVEFDNAAVKAAKKLKVPGVDFKFVSPNEDLPTGENLVVMDGIRGVGEVRVFRDLRKILLSPRGTVHDFDLGFQLKYLQKLGKIKKVTIIGLPMQKKIDYDRLQTILRKLVAQDMQGS